MSPTSSVTETSSAPPRQLGYQPAPLRATRHRSAAASLTFAGAPMLLAAAALGFGILDARWVWRPPFMLLVALVLAAALVLVASRLAERVLAFPILLLWFTAGQFCAAIVPVHPPSALLMQLADGLQRATIGTVIAVHSPRTELRVSPLGRTSQSELTQQVDLALDHIEDFTANRDWGAPVSGGLRLTIYARPGELLPDFHCGERVSVPLRLHRPQRYMDPGAWNYPAYLAQHGIALLGSTPAAGIREVSPPGITSFACLATAAQSWAAGRLDRIAATAEARRWLPAWMQLNRQDTAVLSAMLFGNRTALRHSIRSAFERTGSFHLLVVSGLHITIIIGLIFWLARRLRLGPLPSTVIALLLALPYAFLTGFAPPVQRALWLSAVYLFSRILYRERTALNAIGIAAIGVLVKNPGALFDSSFQMTFLAVLVIAGVAAPLIESTIAPYLRGLHLPRQLSLDPYLPPRVTQLRVSLRMLTSSLQPLIGTRWAWRIPFGVTRWALRIAEALIVALLVELAMMLPMAVYFHRITIAALPANLLGLPLLALLLPLALGTFLLGCMHPVLAFVPGLMTAVLLHAISYLIRFFGHLPAANLRTADPSPWCIACFIAAWIVAMWWVRKTRPWRIAALTVVTIGSLLVLWPAPPRLHKGVLEVTAIDVGQGDSLLIVTPKGKTLLVDAGGPIGGPQAADPQFDVGEDVVSQYLWWRRIRRLDAVALTHAHSDHMGGMPAVLNNFHPRALWVGSNPPTPEYQALLAIAQNTGIPVVQVAAGERFVFGGAHVRILAPAAGYHPGTRASNNDSLVMRLRYGSTAALLDGDAEAPVEREMAATEPVAAELLKVGHHGSNTSTIPPFLAAVHPGYAVISVGAHNPFGHPRMSVLDELAAAHVRVYRTDTLGLSSFLLDGRSVAPLRARPY